MENPEKLAAMSILDSVVSIVFSDEESKNLFGIIGLRMMYLTLKYGMSERAGVAYAQYGGLQAVLGNIPGANRFKHITNEVLNRTSSKAAKTSCQFVLHTLVTQWSESFPVGMEGMKSAYTLGLECGSVSMALWAGSAYLNFSLYTKMPLSNVAHIMSKFRQQMKLHRTHQLYLVSMPLHQTTQNLLGLADDPTKLKGEFIDEDTISANPAYTSDSLFRLSLVSSQLILALLFDDLDLLEEAFPNIQSSLPDLRGHWAGPMLTFQLGLAGYRLWHKTKIRKYRSEALQCTKRLESWVRQGVLNCVPLAKFMQAERLALKTPGTGWMGMRPAGVDESQRVAIAAMIDDAIQEAKDLGVLFWSSSFAARASSIFTTLHPDTKRASAYKRVAVEEYRQWHAYALVTKLEGELDAMSMQSGEATTAIVQGGDRDIPEVLVIGAEQVAE